MKKFEGNKRKKKRRNVYRRKKQNKCKGNTVKGKCKEYRSSTINIEITANETKRKRILRQKLSPEKKRDIKIKQRFQKKQIQK